MKFFNNKNKVKTLNIYSNVNLPWHIKYHKQYLIRNIMIHLYMTISTPFNVVFLWYYDIIINKYSIIALRKLIISIQPEKKNKNICWSSIWWWSSRLQNNIMNPDLTPHPPPSFFEVKWSFPLLLEKFSENFLLLRNNHMNDI